MRDTKRSWDLLTKDKRDACVAEIISYFKEERGEIIGVIAAEALLDFFLQMTAESVYNKAVDDVKNIVRTNRENFDVDLDQLRKE